MIIISTRDVDDDDTTCRRCGQVIQRGRHRATLVLGTGLICVRCELSGLTGHDIPDGTIHHHEEF